MHTLSGVEVDLANFIPEYVKLWDIADSLVQINRFNGHTIRPFSVLEHSLIGADLAETPKQKLECLLHDSAEAYTGDITLPMKEMFPEIREFESRIEGVIFDVLWPSSGLVKDGRYVKTPYMTQLDRRMARWESLYLRPYLPFRQETWDTRERWVHLFSTYKGLDFDGKLKQKWVNSVIQLTEELK